jgi:hypothetical protein
LNGAKEADVSAPKNQTKTPASTWAATDLNAAFERRERSGCQKPEPMAVRWIKSDIDIVYRIIDDIDNNYLTKSINCTLDLRFCA